MGFLKIVPRAMRSANYPCGAHERLHLENVLLKRFIREKYNR